MSTKDGLACIVPYTPANFRDLFAAAGRPELAADPRVAGSTLDPANTEDLQDLLIEATPALTTAEWEEVCAKASIPMAPVLELETAHEQPYVADGHLMDVVEHPTEGAIRSIGIPMRFSGTPASVRRQAPRPGQDTDEVFAELAETR
jgi:crotonobetainyl-CoA:carnitine CoA-transferase CaiB-like acyl-CoA transferase